MLGTLRDNFVSAVSKWPDRKAIIYDDRVYTYGDLNERVNRLANFLVHLGVEKGDGVGLLLYNCAEVAIGFLACQKLGAISSCLNYRLSAGPIRYAVRQERLKALIFNAEVSRTAAEIMKDAGGCRFICVGGPVPDGALSFADCARFAATEPPPRRHQGNRSLQRHSHVGNDRKAERRRIYQRDADHHRHTILLGNGVGSGSHRDELRPGGDRRRHKFLCRLPIYRRGSSDDRRVRSPEGIAAHRTAQGHRVVCGADANAPDGRSQAATRRHRRLFAASLSIWRLRVVQTAAASDS